MRWQDRGIILAQSRLGEKNRIVTVMTCEHGRHKGLARFSRHDQAILNPGAVLSLHWNARLSGHLGVWQFEPVFSPLAWILDNPLPMKCLLSAVSLLEVVVPEREPHPELYNSLENLIYGFRDGGWARAYVFFELSLVAASGFALDLKECALTGVRERLTHVSPRTGRAVSAEAGLPWRDRLLVLPEFLWTDAAATVEDILAALDLTGYFMERYGLGVHGLQMPQARIQFMESLKIQQKRNMPE